MKPGDSIPDFFYPPSCGVTYPFTRSFNHPKKVSIDRCVFCCLQEVCCAFFFDSANGSVAILAQDWGTARFPDWSLCFNRICFYDSGMYHSLPEYVEVGRSEVRVMIRDDVSWKLARAVGCTLLVFGWLLLRALGTGNVAAISLGTADEGLGSHGSPRPGVSSFDAILPLPVGTVSSAAVVAAFAPEAFANVTPALVHLDSLPSFFEQAASFGAESEQSGVAELAAAKSSATTTFKFDWGSHPSHEENAQDSWEVIHDAEERGNGGKLRCQIEQDDDYDKCIEVFYGKVWVPQLSYGTKSCRVEDLKHEELQFGGWVVVPPITLGVFVEDSDSDAQRCVHYVDSGLKDLRDGSGRPGGGDQPPPCRWCRRYEWTCSAARQSYCILEEQWKRAGAGSDAAIVALILNVSTLLVFFFGMIAYGTMPLTRVASNYFMTQVAATIDVVRFYIAAAAMIFVALAVMLAAYGGAIALESGVLGAPDAMGILWKVFTAGHFTAGAYLVINSAVYCLDDGVPARFGAGIPGVRQSAVTALVFWGLWALACTYTAYISGQTLATSAEVTR